MFEKNTLFYAANVEPEIARMFKALDQGNKEVAEKFRDKTVTMITNMLALDELSQAGREEWFAIRNLVLGYDSLDVFSRNLVVGYGKPFSDKFARQFAG